MPGVKALRRIQVGLETVAGTAVASTARYRGMGTMQDEREVIFVDEDLGYLTPVDRTYIPRLAATMTWDEAPASFEQLGYILNAGVVGTTGVADGAGTGFIYTHPFPGAAQQTPYTYTLEGGDDTQAEEMEYSFVESFTLSGESGGPLNVTANWRGRQVTATTFTPTTDVTLPEVETILFSKGKLYLSASTDAFGTSTDVAVATWIDFDLSVTTGMRAGETADGALYFTFVKNEAPGIVATFTFEHNATAIAEKALWRTETVRRIQAKFEGSALSPGTTYSYKTLIVNLIGKWESWDKLGEKDGNDIVSATFRGRYNVTEATAGGFILVNTLSALA